MAFCSSHSLRCRVYFCGYVKMVKIFPWEVSFRSSLSFHGCLSITLTFRKKKNFYFLFQTEINHDKEFYGLKCQKWVRKCIKKGSPAPLIKRLMTPKHCDTNSFTSHTHMVGGEEKRET